MMSCKQVEVELLAEMENMSLSELQEFARSMGFSPLGMTAQEIRTEAVRAELYAFTH